MFSLNKEPSPSKLTLSYWDKTDFVSRPRLLSSLVDNAITVYSYFMPVQGTVKTIESRCWR